MAPGKTCSKCWKGSDTPSHQNSIKPIDQTPRSALGQQSPDDSMMTPLSNSKSPRYDSQHQPNPNPNRRGKKDSIKLNRINYEDKIDSHTGRNELTIKAPQKPTPPQKIPTNTTLNQTGTKTQPPSKPTP